ncbi:polysaccharide deacetylase family protein [Novosphingobium sp.]|uniref:polysaccharide deacetylase family protein n=1 Tax=Novosphingobium sp. TaxID=1874826 RepID=UPI0033419C54
MPTWPFGKSLLCKLLLCIARSVPAGALAIVGTGVAPATARPAPAAVTDTVAVAAVKPPAPPLATVALTYDDLPGIVLKPDQAYLDATNRALLRGLKRHHFPAIGFVNEGKLDEIVRKRQIRVLKWWIRAGYDLGNHTFSHSTPNEIGAAAYIEDIARGETVIRPMMTRAHRVLQWFRHPYLETGNTEAVRAPINHWLATHGYRIAPVTIDCDDWEFAEPYDNAVMAGNKVEAARIRNEYLAYTERTIGWYRRGSLALFGRDIAYVMLLHDTRLNADTFEGFAAILARQNLQPVTLDQALRDPAYQTADSYVGKDGVEWLERWSLTLHKELPWDDYEDVPKGIVKEYDRLDSQ